jgi:hypothetical protein
MNGHCEERSDEAIHRCVIAGGLDPSADATSLAAHGEAGWLRCARNDAGRSQKQRALVMCGRQLSAQR